MLTERNAVITAFEAGLTILGWDDDMRLHAAGPGLKPTQVTRGIFRPARRWSGGPVMKRRHAAFTLLEIMLAIAIAVMVVLVGTYYAESVLAEGKMKKSFEEFDAFVQKARTRAVTEKKTMMLVWDKTGIFMESELISPEEEAGQEQDPQLQQQQEEEPAMLPYPSGGTITIERPAALVKNAPMEWAFWRSGICEPVRVHYESNEGSWIAEYEPLTGHGTLVSTTE